MRFLTAPFHRVSLLEVMKKANKAAKKLMLAKVRIKPTSNAATHRYQKIKQGLRQKYILSYNKSPAFPRKVCNFSSYGVKARNVLALVIEPNTLINPFI